MATNVEAIETPETLTQVERCPNCDNELNGHYCHTCGQKKIHRHEFAVRHFFSHIIHELTHLDSNKILKSFFALLFKPGLLTSEYLAGKKVSYINPVRIYLTFSALYFLFAWGVLSDVRGGGAARTARNPATIAMARQRGVDPRVLADKIYQKAEKYAAILRFASVLISGLFLSLLYIGLHKYYVEHLIFSLHYYSFDFFCKSFFALLFIIAAVFGRRLSVQILNLFYPVALVYLVFALKRVYQEGWLKTGLKSAVLFTCELILFIAVNMAGFFIAFVLV
jgi:hypothetical protein